MGIIKKLKKKRQKLRAKARGMSVKELNQIERIKKTVESEERKKYAKWEIEQKYKEKKKAFKQSGGKSGVLASLANVGKGILDHAEKVSEQWEDKPRRRKRKKK